MLTRFVLGLFLVVAVTQGADPFSHGNATLPGYGGGINLRAQNIFSCSPGALQPVAYYNPGAGCPAVSTADYYHVNGLIGFRPIDLTSPACGSVGASLAASKGRYAWFSTNDHVSLNTAWSDGDDKMVGFSSDHGVLPTTLTPIVRWNNVVANGPGATFQGTISGTVLTVISMTSGALTEGSPLTYSGGTATLANSNTGTGVGQTGTYDLNASSGNVASSTAMTTTQRNVTFDHFAYPLCNPDDSTNPFYFYAQSDGSDFEFGTGLSTSPDLSAFTVFGSSHRILSQSQIARAMQVTRTGVNTWKSIGLTSIYPTDSREADASWTSADGKYFSFGSFINNCLPSNSGSSTFCANGSSYFEWEALPDGLTTTTGGQAYLAGREDANVVSNSNTAGQYITMAPVDGSYNVIASPSTIRISNAYCNDGGASCFPGPRFLQSVGSYNESGIAHFYPVHGFFACLQAAGCMSSQKTFATGGGLSQQFVDHYCYVIDATAAANAAPTGVTASAAAGVVTLSWDGCLSGVTYRIYQGTSAASQPVKIADIASTGTTITPNLQVPTTLYFKVVTLNGGVEEGSRVVSAYVSSSSKLINQHIARALAARADPATVDRAWLDSVDGFMTAQGLQNNLRTWVDPAFGVKQDGSGNTSIAFDLGTTRLPRGGDLTFCTISGGNCSGASTAVYSPTAFGTPGTTPGVANPSTNGFSYFGGSAGGRVNNLRRMVQITACSVYSKPGTALATLVGYGGADFNPPNMVLQHTAGTPGNASFTLWDDVQGKTVTAAMSSATGPHVICGTFDTTGAASPTSTGTLKVYADGVVTGSPDTSLHSNIDISLPTTLMGQLSDVATVPFLGAGSTSSKVTAQTAGVGPLVPYSYVYEQNEGNFTWGATIIFDVALTQAQITALTNLYLNRITPPTATAYNITSMPSGASATCNGSADDSAAFANFNTLAKTWDAANPGVTGAIVLNIPNSKCMFLQGGAGISINKGIVNHTVRIIGAGASSEFSDNGTGGGWFLGSAGQANDNAHSIRVATATKGSTAVTLNSLTNCASLWIVGQWALVTGYDMQGGGFPSNPAFWDYVKISAVNCGTGVVTFATTPLTHDYKSTWPNYVAGGAFAIDQGGPATIYSLDASWPLTLEVNNLKLSLTNVASDGEAITGKDIMLKNVTINTTDGATCEVPSQNMSYRIVNATMTSCAVEVDKIIDTLLLQNVSAVKSVDFQSASVKQAIFSEIDATTTLNGSAINTIIANSTLASWGPGVHSFGASYGQTYILGNSLPSISVEGTASSAAVNTVGTWSGGTWTIADASISSVSGGNPALNFIVPGANLYWGGGHGSQGPLLQVADVSHSGSNTIVSFNQNGSPYAGAFPTMPLNAGSATAKVHPIPQLTAIGNYGSAQAIDLNQGTPGAPWGQYSKLIVAGTNGSYSAATAPPTVTGNSSTPYTAPVWGTMVGVNITVGTAYAGSTGTMHFDLNSPFFQTLGATTNSQWNTFEINAKAASTTPRVLDPTSTSGAQTGDTLTSPTGGANTWFLSDQNQPVYSSIPGDFGSTSTTIEITTNQGVVNPAQY